MTRKRNRKRPMLSFQERLNKFAQEARAAAKALPPGAERHELLLKARQGEAAATIERWPGAARTEVERSKKTRQPAC